MPFEKIAIIKTAWCEEFQGELAQGAHAGIADGEESHATISSQGQTALSMLTRHQSASTARLRLRKIYLIGLSLLLPRNRRAQASIWLVGTRMRGLPEIMHRDPSTMKIFQLWRWIVSTNHTLTH
jgi:hypothetical protein